MTEKTARTTANAGARKRCALTGVGIGVLGLSADSIGLGGAPGLGRTQQLMILGGLAILVTAIVLPTRYVRTLLRVGVSTTATYAALLICDVLVFLFSPQLKDPTPGLQGLFVADETTGFRLTPNWDGWYDDGVVRAKYRINSLGHRDREPARRERVQVLLIGDSFAFGAGLNQSETIDRQLEAMTDPSVDAYNLGIPGYGPPSILETFSRCDWYEPQHVVYVFCYNDLRDDGLLPHQGVTCFDGYLVPKFKTDGSRYTSDEYQKVVQRKLSLLGNGCLKTLGKMMKLTHLGRRFAVAGSETPDEHPFYRYSDANVTLAMTYTRRMLSLAAERGATFHVLVVPLKGEARLQRYGEYAMKYVEGLQDADIAVIEVIDGLSETDYLLEGHLNASGARRVADAIRECLRLKRVP